MNSQQISKITILGKSYCRFTTEARMLLLKYFDRDQIDYIVVDDNWPQWRQSIKTDLGLDVVTVPQIWLDDEHIGGFTDLASWAAKN